MRLLAVLDWQGIVVKCAAAISFACGGLKAWCKPIFCMPILELNCTALHRSELGKISFVEFTVRHEMALGSSTFS